MLHFLRALKMRLNQFPHARLLLLRLAHREAAVRAGGQLGVMQVEIGCRLVGDDIAVEIDVSAPLLSPATRATRK